MKYLLINGSPKSENSNSMKLTRAFMEGAGWTDGDKVDVSKANIKGCMGCYTCWLKTPGVCAIKDDMNDIFDKLVSADVVIWSFPLYYFSVPGILKNLIDRQLPMFTPVMSEGTKSGGHPPRFNLSKQRHILISTCGFWTAKGNYEGVTFMYDKSVGRRKYDAIFCGQGELFRMPEQNDRTGKYLEIVKRAGQEFAAGGISADTHLALAEPIYEQKEFEKMSNASLK